jgi:organic radical activating enzyme
MKVNAISCEALMVWLKKYIEPKEWVIEITGGEPGLHPEINEIISALNSCGYKGLIKTNGTTDIKKNNGFKIITAWHKDCDCPTHYDTILIIKNPNDNWKAKVQYCKDKKLPYKTVLFSDNLSSVVLGNKNKIIKEYLHINSMGQISECAKTPIQWDYNIFEEKLQKAPVTKKLLQSRDACSRCKNVNDVEIFMEETA